ncbi:hypothetical protein M501DRAFT_988639 [Patellaria atrata CBS 101060]|uniref:Protein kinase domain-containing protein n=1 Tax=Patellaria atrata CBS 101060 TaxID=1346257 RepID=A0A9P4SHJ6_9PEZI|nr:hypothetical protein M501DRAFT_988639 [Patellaria atrata CBS 101060]
MNDVADTDLREYLHRSDEYRNKSERVPGEGPYVVTYMRQLMDFWRCCLIYAIDYLHEMRIKHKDIKPSNILIGNRRILIANFGISKDVLDQETTASLTANGD